MKLDIVQFVERSHCIACGSTKLVTLDHGFFDSEPLRGFLEQDPWGDSPVPFLKGCRWEYVKCADCSQMFQKKLLSQEWQEIKFSKWMSASAIHEFEKRRGAENPTRVFDRGRQYSKHVLRLEAMTRPIRSGEKPRVLDFGCGWGGFLAMSHMYGFEAFGIERAPDRKDFLQTRGITVYEDLGSIKSLLSDSFHAVTLFQVLEHLDEPLALLKSLGRLMMPGAILVVEVPNCGGVTGIKSQQDYYAIHPLEHFNCFTPSSLTAMAVRAGFAPVFPILAHVTTSRIQLMKTEIKGVFSMFMPRSTNQYFRKV